MNLSRGRVSFSVSLFLVIKLSSIVFSLSDCSEGKSASLPHHSIAFPFPRPLFVAHILQVWPPVLKFFCFLEWPPSFFKMLKAVNTRFWGWGYNLRSQNCIHKPLWYKMFYNLLTWHTILVRLWSYSKLIFIYIFRAHLNSEKIKMKKGKGLPFKSVVYGFKYILMSI